MSPKDRHLRFILGTTVAQRFGNTHYFDQGAVLQPGKSCDVTFSAFQTGEFEIFGTFDPYLRPEVELAQLNVNP